MNNGNKKSKSTKEITHDYKLRSGASSKRRIICSNSSDSDDSRHPNRPAPVVERSRVFIQDLPEEMMLAIFECLDFNNLCRASRVCKTWYEYTRNEQFWRKIKTNISNNSWFRLIRILSSCLTNIHLISDAELRKRRFLIFSRYLQKRCPNLKTLILHRFSFIRECLNFYSHLPQNLRILVLTSCEFIIEDIDVCENRSPSEMIEVLDLSHSRCVNFSRPIFNNYDFKYMQNLKKLHLAGCGLSEPASTFAMSNVIKNLSLLNLEQNDIGFYTFLTIRMFGIHLTELYVCWTRVKDDDLIIDDFQKDMIFNKLHLLPELKNLEKICLRGCNVTSHGIGSLIQYCPALRSVSVGNEELHPGNNYSECNTEIVKVLNGFRYCNHNEKADYMHE